MVGKQIFSSSYQIIALYGAIVGFFMAKRWGGHKSLFGKTLIFFSIGLFLQFFGQFTYGYYNIFQHIAVPYPSLGDVGYFGSTVAYIIGAVYLLKTTEFTVSWSFLRNKFYTILIPCILLLISYWFFLRGYEFDWTNKLRIFLDFGYPFGDALYISIALIALVASYNFLGGSMRKSILLLIFALIIQYASDFTFLYQANAGTWSIAGFNDYSFSICYFLMTVALIHIGQMSIKMKNGLI